MKFIVFLATNLLVAHATYYFSHSPKEIPGNYTIWKLETGDENGLTNIASGLEEAYTSWSIVSGAAQCGSRYYASAVDAPIEAALLVSELDQDGKTQILTWDNFGGNYNLHNMYCDPSDPSGQTLLVVENIIGDSPSQFSLFRMTIDSNYKITQDKIADLPNDTGKITPTNYDTEFQMSPDLKTLYAMWTNPGMNLGFIQTVDVQSGAVTSYTMSGIPYALLVNSNGNTEIVTIKITTNGQAKYFKCKLSLAGSSATTTNCAEADDLFTGGQPWTSQNSDGSFYTVRSASGSQSIVTINSEGSITNSLALQDEFKKAGISLSTGTFGGLAVVPGKD